MLHYMKTLFSITNAVPHGNFYTATLILKYKDSDIEQQFIDRFTRIQLGVPTGPQFVATLQPRRKCSTLFLITASTTYPHTQHTHSI